MADPRLHLLQLASPALPVGAYAYSQGLELVIEAGWVDDDTLPAWLEDGLRLGLAQLDLLAVVLELDDLVADLLGASVLAPLLLDRELGEQTFGVGSPMPYQEDPSLWATLELVRDER